MKNGIAGRIAAAFITSKLTLLLTIAGILLGVFSIMMIPSEEEPQIEVPMIDIFIGYPGGSPKEIETKLTKPLEKIISNVKGVEHVYSTSMNDQALFIVQFYVGEDIEHSEVKLYSELLKNMDQMPENATPPLLKLRSIDDVPIYALTLWSEHYSDAELNAIADHVADAFKQENDVAGVHKIGGREQEVKVVLNKEKMNGLNVDALSIAEKLKAQNQQLSGGLIYANDKALSIRTGNFLTSAEEVKNLIVGVNGEQPVYLRQVAEVVERPESPTDYITFGYGAASPEEMEQFPSQYNAVTLVVRKKSGSDAMAITKRLDKRVKDLEKTLIPSDVQTTVTQDSGKSASEKVNELLLHLGIAILAVTLFVMLAMGWRGGMVVFLSVPVTFALTIMTYYFMDYTLNRITLFALVFIVGIVVDDSIIIAEYMHRHFKQRKRSYRAAAIYSINEVGNPTILATFTVVAAVLPMAFVSGMMGPYMSPMPIGAAVAMILSLLVALTLTPYLGYVFLREKDKKGKPKTEPQRIEDSRMYRIYYRVLHPMLNTRSKRWAFMVGVAALLLVSFTFFKFNWVKVKMLPFDNKNEFQIVIDMPEGTPLERTQAATLDIASYLASHTLVKDYQTYVGTASPITFSGLVRHYDLRRANHSADVKVNIVDKKDRKIQSHPITEEMRGPVKAIADQYGAKIKFVEISPGPPVRSTLVAEIYGPDSNARKELASQVKALLNEHPNVVDLDWSIEDDEPEYHFVIDQEKAMKNGIAPIQITQTIAGLTNGLKAGVLHREQSYHQIPITLQLADKDKDRIAALHTVPVLNQQGKSVILGSFGTWKKDTKPKSIHRKDQKELIYITGEMAGDFESPIYVMTDIFDDLAAVNLPAGYHLNVENTAEPRDESEYSLKWDGEWQITYEVFRDLGIAFGAVIILIYILIVGWFHDFKVPIVMLAAIPLSLIGIIIMHWALDAYFTATSMIGFIALAGVMVRNSILLIDFVNIRLRQGETLQQAILEAGAVRTTPILLTAGAVILGAVIILADPVFQGLAISLIGGTLTSTFLTLLVVPLLYFKMLKKKYGDEDYKIEK